MTTGVINPRDNEAWVSALRSDDQCVAAELRDYLVRVFAKTFARYDDVADDDIHDFAQDSLVRILASIDSFRSDSAFTTWATSIALRAAFTEVRRRRARRDGERRFEEASVRALDTRVTRGSLPGEASEARALLGAALHRAIDECLTDRQRIAITCELAGIPTVDIAQRLETNQNALYKLVHDARKKLRGALRRAGYTPEAVRESLADR